MDIAKKLKHISLCTGYAGIDLGLQRAIRNVRTICYVEIEAFAIHNLVSKIEAGLLDYAPIYTDVKSFPWQWFDKKVDIISGGFPCQPFSTAGRSGTDQDPRHLFPYICQGIRICRPAVVFLENVEGIISSKLKGDQWTDPKGTPVLLHVLRELERLGYKATASIFSACEVGAPHQRKRVFILGIRNELTESAIDYVNKLIESTEPKQIVYPASRGQQQYWYEPPRVTMGHTKHDGLPNSKEYRNSGETSNGSEEGQNSTIESQEWSIISITNEENSQKQTNRPARCNHNRCEKIHRQIKSKMGRDVDGPADWLDHDELYTSVDNRTDELRLLGNGVVPDTAKKAFVTMWRELVNTSSKRF